MAVELEVGTNSYISVADANTYFEARLGSSAWNDAGDDKAVALIQATRSIDMQAFTGRKKTTTQNLNFPRCFWDPGRKLAQHDEEFSTDDHIWGKGWWCQQDIVQLVKDATCEEALALLETNGDSARRDRIRDGVVSVRIGDVEERYSDPVVQRRANGRSRLLSAEARSLLAGYLAGSVATT